ncbi:nitrous oxide reductase family maturation protein NosD [Streptomyces sp. NPDC058417]|uniref:right-handed parallel beta-helix repeat-containing protein n=1 Tax=unclassified Streptomyces TaxID=2593676 RepID=UPI00364958D9
MTKYHIAYLACTAAVVGAGLGAAPSSAAGHHTHVVRPGQSIQQAVDAAAPGDTVLVTRGTYRESVTVTTPRLTLRGLGPGVVIEPGAAPATTATAATPATGAARVAADCASSGNGVCVVGTKANPVEGVTLSSLTVTGFTKSGVHAYATDGLNVRNVTAVKNGVWGIAQEASTRGVFRGNTARDNGDAGLFLANTVTEEEGATDTLGTRVERNRLEGNRIGVTVRRLRNLTVEDNRVTGNCAGVFLVGDENKPKAGAVTVAANTVVANNKSCPKTARLDALQGSGIVLTGTEDALLTDNEIHDNAGNSPLSGGIVLLKSFVGATSDRNRVSDNRLSGNVPADLVDQSPGKDNTFQGNTCALSRPAGLC